MVTFSEALKPSLIKADLENTDKLGVFNEMVQLLVDNYPQLDKEVLLSSILEREAQMSTGIITHIAIPHCRLSGVDNSLVCLGISKKGIDYGSLDSEPVFIVLMMVASSKGSDSHLALLKNLSLMANVDDFIDEITTCETSQQIYDSLQKFEKMALGEQY